WSHYCFVATRIWYRNRSPTTPAACHRSDRRIHIRFTHPADYFAGYVASVIQKPFSGNYRIKTDLAFTFTKMHTMKYLSRLIATIVFFVLSAIGFAQQSSGYKLSKTFKIASGGGWDYIAVYDHKLFVSHATQVNILDASTGDSLGYIPGTTGVHGVAFIP